MQIKITSIFVNDQEKALNFYTEVLGFKKKVLKLMFIVTCLMANGGLTALLVSVFLLWKDQVMPRLLMGGKN